MDIKNYKKIQRSRCGRTIITAAVASMTSRPSYKQYGNICPGCMTEKEREMLSQQQIDETYMAAKRYCMAGVVDWDKEIFEDDEKQVLQYIAMKNFYTKTFPTMMEIYMEFNTIDIPVLLKKLENRGFIKPLI